MERNKMVVRGRYVGSFRIMDVYKEGFVQWVVVRNQLADGSYGAVAGFPFPLDEPDPVGCLERKYRKKEKDNDSMVV